MSRDGVVSKDVPDSQATAGSVFPPPDLGHGGSWTVLDMFFLTYCIYLYICISISPVLSWCKLA